MEHSKETCEAEVFAALSRYIDAYHWSWNMARRLINRYFGMQYTETDLKRLYRASREGQSC